MNSLPDIVVLDFCEWLNQQFHNNVNERPPILDILMSNGNNRYRLEEYAHDFLFKTRGRFFCLNIIFRAVYHSSHQQIHHGANRTIRQKNRPPVRTFVCSRYMWL